MLPITFTAAIFDVDGTLLDTMDVWRQVDVQFLARRGIEYTADYGAHMAALYYELAARYTIDRFGLSETPAEVMAEWDELARDAYARTHEVPGALAYLRALKDRGVKLAYATSGNDYLTVPTLEAHGMLELFSAGAYTKETGKDKSEPDVYLLAAERLGVPPEECVVFEDVPRCIRGAKRGGFPVVALDTDPKGSDELRETADYVIRDFLEEL